MQRNLLTDPALIRVYVQVLDSPTRELRVVAVSLLLDEYRVRYRNGDWRCLQGLTDLRTVLSLKSQILSCDKVD